MLNDSAEVENIVVETAPTETKTVSRLKSNKINFISKRNGNKTEQITKFTYTQTKQQLFFCLLIIFWNIFAALKKKKQEKKKTYIDHTVGKFP